jgi:hypothetical protein
MLANYYFVFIINRVSYFFHFDFWTQKNRLIDYQFHSQTNTLVIN